MSVITLSTSLIIQDFTWGELRNDLVSRSSFGAQTIQIIDPWWTMSMSFDAVEEDQADLLYTFMMSLKGQENQLAAWNVGRPNPRGTMRGSPTLSSAITAGDTSLPITNATQPGLTLRAGDFLGIGSALTQQVVMVQANLTLDGSGLGTASVLPPIRNDFASGTAIRHDKPKALFRRIDNKTLWNYSTVNVSGFTMEFVEDPRA